MRHDYVVEGFGYRLRPAGDDDADFIVGLRTDDVLTRYLPRISASRERQLEWFASYYKTPGDYYFIVERKIDGAAEGAISVYNIGVEPGGGEWGRWVLRHGSLAAVESALLIYRFGLSTLKLGHMYSRTFAANLPVLSIHDRCGTRRAVLPGFFKQGEEAFDAIEHLVQADRLPAVEAALGPLAKRTAELLTRKKT